MLASCIWWWLWLPFLLMWRRPEGRRTRAQSREPFHTLSPSRAHSCGSTEQLRSSDGLMQVGWRPLYQKKARCPLFPQKFCATTSRRAPSSLLAVRWCSCSPVTGWRDGSVPTLWHTSLNRSAVISLISLWRIDGNPPCLQLSACSMVFLSPQTHWEGRWGGCHPYRRHNYGVSKCSFVKGKTMLSYWECWEPLRGALLSSQFHCLSEVAW